MTTQHTGFVLVAMVAAWGLLGAPAEAASIRLLDPTSFALGLPGGFATRVVEFAPVAPLGDTNPGLDGSAALFAPDDIGFYPEPDSNLSVALGDGGAIELTFARSIVNDGVIADGTSIEGSEVLVFEDGELDGAIFFGRRRADLTLVQLGSLAEVAILDPVVPGLGPNSRDTMIAIDLDVLGSSLDLVAIRIVDDAITGDSQTFEVDAVANLSPGSPVPEPGVFTLLGTGIAGLGLARQRWRDPKGARSAAQPNRST